MVVGPQVVSGSVTAVVVLVVVARVVVEVEGAGEDGGASEAGLPLQLAQIVVELPLSAYRGPFQPAYRTVAGRRLTCVEV